jgi:hypothetical protein
MASVSPSSGIPAPGEENCELQRAIIERVLAAADPNYYLYAAET